jgi:hypothetical protein
VRVTLAIEDAIDIYREGQYRGITVLTVRLLSGTLQRGELLEVPSEGAATRCAIVSFESFVLWRMSPPAAIDDSIGPVQFGLALASRQPLAARVKRGEHACSVARQPA